MNDVSGCIFDIQRFSLHDGPGIRTTVFLKGCNLSCFWCHNPESVNRKPELQIYAHKCIGCGRCAGICPQNAIRRVGEQNVFLRELCTGCGSCTAECFAGARVLAGKQFNTTDVMIEIEKDIPFYLSSGGGVTFSGGEPLLQVAFLKALLAACRERHIHTAVDTAGHVPYQCFEEIIPFTDLFLYDIKVMNERTHIQATGVSNRLILKNLQQLSRDCRNIIIRIPIVPGVNDDEENIRRTGEFLKQLDGVKKVELLSFHKMAAGKYDALGREYKAANIQLAGRETMLSIRNILSEYVLTDYHP